MHGIKVVSLHPLSKLLAPVARELDKSWWYIGGAGASLVPRDRPRPPPVGAVADLGKWAHDNAEWLAACQRESDEYARWVDVDAEYRVGIPGWYSRYIDVVDQDWALYFACDGDPGSTLRTTLDSLDALVRRGVDW